MKNKCKRILSVLLVTALLIGIAPVGELAGLLSVTAFAEDYEGICGDNLTWTLNEDTGELIISGYGNMTDWGAISSVPWYANRDAIKTVTIGNGVESIGKYAFFGNINITNVSIPESLTKISDCAFYDCDSLIKVTIPKNVTSIGNEVFYSCDSLKWITVGINNPAFICADGALYNRRQKELIQFPIANEQTDYRILDGVTRIGDYSFSGSKSLINVYIPGSVTSIGKYAFADCSAVTDIYYDGKEADWAAITVGASNELLLNANIHFKENPHGTCGHSLYWSFYPETGLLEITGSGAMDFGEASVSPWNKYRSSITSVSLPDELTSICDSAFEYCDHLTSVAIPYRVAVIGEMAFRGCSKLTNITIPESVAWIGNRAFSGCSSLESISIPDSVTDIGNSAFLGCKGLKNVTFGNGVKNIGNNIFTYCDNLTNVIFSEGIISISDGMFFDCDSLVYVSLPTTVTNIGQQAFSYCHSLTTITFGEHLSNIGDFAFSFCSSLTSISIPESVTNIGRQAFRSCEKLETVYISNGVANIDESAFDYCNGLTGFTVDIENDNYSSDSVGVLFDKNKTRLIRYPAGNIESSYMIPDGVTLVCDNAFYECCNLTSVSISNSVVSIGGYAFYNCSGLINVTIPDGVTSIGEFSFAYCQGLSSISIPSSITNIGIYAFFNCRNLTSVSLGSSVSKIELTVFGSCNQLQQLIVLGRNTAFELSSSTVPKNTLICGPKNSGAQGYAERYGREFLEISGNGDVDLTFNASANGGTICVDGKPYEVTKEYELTDLGKSVGLTSLYSAEKDGWTFVGWNTDPSATVPMNTYRITKSATLYAIFRRMGGVSLHTLTQEVQTLSENMYNRDIRIQVTLPDIPPYTDANGDTWKGIGWTENEEPTAAVQYEAGQDLYFSPGKQLYALYERERDSEYTVTYASDIGMNNMPQPEYLRCRMNAADPNEEAFVLKVSSTVPVPEVSDSMFTGWKTARDAELYFAGDEKTIKNPENLALYASFVDFLMSDPKQIATSERYSFTNTPNYFSSYALPDDWWPYLQSKVTEAEYTSMWSESRKEVWNGSCMGMCATMALFKSGDLNRIRSDFSIPSFLSAVNTKNQPSVLDVINYYQLLQYTEKGKTFRYHNVNDRTTSPEQLKKLVKNLVVSEYPVLFSMVMFNTNGDRYSHALLAHDLKRGANGEYSVSVVDPTGPQMDYTLSVSTDFSTADFSSNWYELYASVGIESFAIDCSDTVENSKNSFNCYSLQDVLPQQTQPRMMMRSAGMSLSATAPTATEPEHPTFLTTSYLNFKITRSDGVFAVVEDGTVTEGTLPVEFYSVNNGIGMERSVTFKVPDITGEAYYTIVPSAQERSILADVPLQWFETALFNNDPQEGFYLYVSAEQAGQVELYADGRIATIYSEDVQQKITSAVNNSDALWDSLNLEGTSRGFLFENDGEKSVIIPRSETAANLTLRSGSRKTTLENAAMNTFEAYTIEKGANAFSLKAENGSSVTILNYPISVSFYTNGGSYVSGKTLTRSEDGAVAVPKPTNPFRYGYIFDKWCTADGEDWDFETDRTSADIRLYAKWKRAELLSAASGVQIADEDTIRVNEKVLHGLLQNVSVSQDCTASYADGWKGNGTGSEVILYHEGQEVRRYGVDVVGDVNGDGAVDLKDTVLLERQLAGWDVFILGKDSADVNADGETDLKDTALMKRYVCGWNVELI